MRAALLLVLFAFTIQPHAAAADVYQVLREPIDVTWQHVSLQQALADVREARDINIVADWSELGSLDILPTTQFSLQLEAAPLWLVLDLMMQALPGSEALWQVRGNTILLITEHSRLYQFETRVYDVRQLVGLSAAPGGRSHLIRMADASERDLAASSATVDPDRRDDDAWRMLALIEAITMSVSPDMWVDSGGMSTVMPYQGRLVVRAPARLHGELMELLALLAESQRVPRPLVFHGQAVPRPTYSQTETYK